MIRIAVRYDPEKRGWDKFGGGHFGASRGSRTHKGIDYAAPVGSVVLAPVGGVVTKIGYPYADDTSYRYVEITSGRDRRHRVFYVLPLRLQVGDEVGVGDPIGTAQDLEPRYPGITPHIHYEVMTASGSFLNPEGVGSV